MKAHGLFSSEYLLKFTFVTEYSNNFILFNLIASKSTKVSTFDYDRMDDPNEKIQLLQLRLRNAKISKCKLKRKLKIKLAQQHLKMKAKLGYLKKLVRKMKKNAIAIVNSKIDNNGEIVIDEMIESDSVQKIDHSYAKPYDEKPIRMHLCPDCRYKTNKKDNLKKHQVRKHGEIERDMKCVICDKLFLYDELRGHLRYYATGKHTAKNEHAKYTPDEHKKLLEDLKQLKKR